MKNIILQEKDEYTEYDIYVSMHEFGHMIEHMKKGILYNVLLKVNVLELFAYIGAVVMDLLFIIKDTEPNVWYWGINMIAFALIIIKLSSVYYIENGANKWAVKLIGDFGCEMRYSEIKKMAVYAIWRQDLRL